MSEGHEERAPAGRPGPEPAAPPDRAQVEALLRGVVLRHAKAAPGELPADPVLTRDLGFDSLAMLLALTEAEEALGVTLPVEELDVRGLTLGGFVDVALAAASRGAGRDPLP